jgi:hypothetical protein
VLLRWSGFFRMASHLHRRMMIAPCDASTQAGTGRWQAIDDGAYS